MHVLGRTVNVFNPTGNLREKMLVSCKACVLIPLCIYCVIFYICNGLSEYNTCIEQQNDLYNGKAGLSMTNKYFVFHLCTEIKI